MDAAQFKKYIVIPVLSRLDMYSRAAVNLLLGTAAQESEFKWIHQLNGGPALGLYQIEPKTANDIYDNYLKYNPEIRDQVNAFAGLGHLEKPYPQYMRDMVMGNLFYATALARCQYRRQKEKLPDSSDVPGMARYWKTYFNTHLGKGTEEEFIANYKKYVEVLCP